MAKGKVNGKVVRRESVPAAKFVEVFTRLAVQGRSIKDIATELGMSPASVSVRASGLRHRKDGKPVNLPNINRVGGGRSLDVDALNAIAEKALTGQSA